MATLSANYKESAIASLADIEANINAFFTSADTRLQALPDGGTFTLATGSLTITMLANDGAGVQYSHRITHTLNIALIADSVTLVTGLEVYLAIILAESRYDTIEEADVNMSLSLSN